VRDRSRLGNRMAAGLVRLEQAFAVLALEFR
jgi:hypothetical protein